MLRALWSFQIGDNSFGTTYQKGSELIARGLDI